MRPIFDSRDPDYKRPFGAVPAGTEIFLSVAVPKIHVNSEPVLKLYELDHWDEPIVVLMNYQDSDLLSNHYQCSFYLDKPAVYVYYFEIFTDGELLSVKKGSHGTGVFDDHGQLWQLTIYDGAMECPAFLQEGVMYQIFPDRFYNSGAPKEGVPGDRWLRSDWGGIPNWRPNEKGEVTNSDYFCGDLRGITEKLDYLQSLGVTALYLNPIFEAHSNHRYNTADYRKVDPLLGSNEDFRELCEKAAAKGISVILDGVFSHTGSDSVYFNMEKRYGNGGAYNDPDSPYRPWYKFSEYPRRYESWWGFKTLPNVDELNEAYREFICGEQGVLRQWLDLGASGFRLDVADELPDEFLDDIRIAIKSAGTDNAIIGEVWEDASNKVSYGVRRRYLLGRQLDSVMNYPFKDAVLSYVRFGNADNLYNSIMQILENYPPPAIQAMMNMLSTHDTIRAITALAGKHLDTHDRQWQEQHQFLSDEDYQRGRDLFALASILQFGLPGIPCVYYGDEAGLTGYKDPFNRVCYPWGAENQELVEHIRSLGMVRRDYPIFADAEFIPLTFSNDLCSFFRMGQEIRVLFAVNRSQGYQKLVFASYGKSNEPIVKWGEYQNGALGPRSGVVIVYEN